jgi:hypothetical protein
MPTLRISCQRRWLLSQNSLLKRDGVYNWTLPAFVTRLRDGRRINVCPNAGICAGMCYARTGYFMMPEAKAAHERNLRMVVDRLPWWEKRMTRELRARRYHGRHVRIHDSGDFFTDAYLCAWLRIIRATPWVTFYAYTKEVSRFKRLVECDPPTNFQWIYSLGGREDHLINHASDRHADVFPSRDAANAAGYDVKLASDLFAIYSPNHVGLLANKIPGFRKKQGAHTFGELQARKTVPVAA